jgi:hypothetical protein
MSPVNARQDDLTVQVPTTSPPQADTLLQPLGGLPPVPLLGVPPVALVPPVPLACPPLAVCPPLGGPDAPPVAELGVLESLLQLALAARAASSDALTNASGPLRGEEATLVITNLTFWEEFPKRSVDRSRSGVIGRDPFNFLSSHWLGGTPVAPSRRPNARVLVTGPCRSRPAER